MRLKRTLHTIPISNPFRTCLSQTSTGVRPPRTTLSPTWRIINGVVYKAREIIAAGLCSKIWSNCCCESFFWRIELSSQSFLRTLEILARLRTAILNLYGICVQLQVKFPQTTRLRLQTWNFLSQFQGLKFRPSFRTDRILSEKALRKEVDWPGNWPWHRWWAKAYSCSCSPRT